MTSDPFYSDNGPLGSVPQRRANAQFDVISDYPHGNLTRGVQAQAEYSKQLYNQKRHLYEYDAFTNQVIGDRPEDLLRCPSCNAIVTRRFTDCPFCDGAMRNDVQRTDKADSVGNPEEREQDTSGCGYPNLGEREHEVHGSRDPDRTAGRQDTGASAGGEATDSAVSGSGGDPKSDDPA